MTINNFKQAYIRATRVIVWQENINCSLIDFHIAILAFFPQSTLDPKQARPRGALKTHSSKWNCNENGEKKNYLIWKMFRVV